MASVADVADMICGILVSFRSLGVNAIKLSGTPCCALWHIKLLARLAPNNFAMETRELTQTDAVRSTENGKQIPQNGNLVCCDAPGSMAKHFDGLNGYRVRAREPDIFSIDQNLDQLAELWSLTTLS
jgi:hypothetical protein